MAVQPGKDVGARWRTVAIVMVAISLLALAALACVLSYPSLHALAGQAAVSPTQAKVYPMIFDAMLVIAASAVLALRGAGLFSRIYAWLSLLVLLAALVGGGVVRAAGIGVPRRSAAITAAALPWALVLIGFGLLVTLLGYARQRRSDGRAVQAVAVQPQAAAIRPQTARPEANDDEARSAIATDTAIKGEPGAGHHARGSLADPAASASGNRPRKSARPADLQLRARIPASRTPSADETMRHDVTTPSGTIAPAGPMPASTAPASTAPPDTKPAGRHASSTAEDTSPGIAILPASPADTSPGIAHPDAEPESPGSPASPPEPSPRIIHPPVGPFPPADTPPGFALPSDGPVPPPAEVAASGEVPPLGGAATATSQTAPNLARPYVPEGAEPLAPPPVEPPEFRRPHSSPTPPEG
jgi:hypothetical protein